MSRIWLEPETEPFATPFRAAEVVRVVDADTLDLVVDVGFDVLVRARVRLLTEAAVWGATGRVDAWEVRGAERLRGLEAKAWVETLLPPQAVVRVFSGKGGTRGSFNRWLAAVFLPVERGWVSLGDLLVEEGLAT